MKIFKISQNFQMIAQDPNAPNDSNVQLQNLQNAQNALQYFENLTNSTEQIMNDIAEIESTLGMGDIGLKNQFLSTIKQAAESTPAFNLLAQMNFISSIDNLMDSNQISNVSIIIQNNQLIII